MMHAYDEVYLDDAMETLGGAVEYATLFCDIAGQEFLDLFVVSGVAKEFGKGNVTYLSGMSGIELARHILERCGKGRTDVSDLPYVDYPPEYWIGWILAYYQWDTAKPFEAILKRITYEDLERLYGVLHEADPSKAVCVLNELWKQEGETNLARLRKAKGLSQAQLAKISGVSVRSVQLYEQRQTDIKKAQYNHLKALANVLGCTVEDILEP